MANQSINAADNPALASSKIAEALAPQQTTVEPAEITSPSDNLVNLPGGYVLPTGEVIRTAEVRELTGKDEEAISRTEGLGRIFSTIISRGVAKIGTLPATDTLLDELLSGDLDALTLGIYRATFGNTAVIKSYCDGCRDYKDVSVDIDEDIKHKVLVDPANDRKFTVKTPKHEYSVILPNGAVQRELTLNLDKSNSEMRTILLQGTVMSIDGRPVVSKNQVLEMSVTDRKAVANEIINRAPGPKFEDVTITCPDCGGKVAVPINLGTLFQF